MSTLWVGVDGGGTRATCVAMDARGRVVARRDGGAALLDPERLTSGVAALVQLIGETISEAGGRPPVRGLCCALAGAGRVDEREPVRAALAAAALADVVLVIADAEAALHAAFGDGPGILLIAGTGSIAWARAASGATLRVGGWGEKLGDEGSGYGIGMAALRAVARADDGRGVPTLLTPVVLRAAGVAEPAALVGWVAGAPKAAIAALAPVVIAAAADDAAASAIVDAAVAALLEHVAVARRRAGPWSAPAPLALAGGLIAPAAPLREALERALRSGLRSVELDTRAVDAAAGAAELAKRTAP